MSLAGCEGFRFAQPISRAGSLFGAHPGSAKFRDYVDLTASVLQDELDAETGKGIER